MQLTAALKVVVTDPVLSAVIKALDPQAFKQALNALDAKVAAENVVLPNRKADWGVICAQARAAFEHRILEVQK